MTTLYLTAAILGGTLFLLQLLLSLLGVGGGDGDAAHDVGHVVDHDSLFWGILSFRAIVAAVTAFGLAGMAARSMGAAPVISLPVALVVGLAAMVFIGFSLRTLVRLADDGTAHIENAIGAQGIVYITIPPRGDGSAGPAMGKVHLNLQHRTVELDAVTCDNHKLESGTRVTVTGIVGPGMVEVIAAPEMGSPYAHA